MNKIKYVTPVVIASSGIALHAKALSTLATSVAGGAIVGATAGAVAGALVASPGVAASAAAGAVGGAVAGAVTWLWNQAFGERGEAGA